MKFSIETQVEDTLYLFSIIFNAVHVVLVSWKEKHLSLALFYIAFVFGIHNIYLFFFSEKHVTIFVINSY